MGRRAGTVNMSSVQVEGYTVLVDVLRELYVPGVRGKLRGISYCAQCEMPSSTGMLSFAL